MSNIAKMAQKELEAREDLKATILSIIDDRCVRGDSRISRGALQIYVYSKMGFHGKPGNYFSRFFTKIMKEEGYRDVSLRGWACYYGLTWKGEEPIPAGQKSKDGSWRFPKALDIPVWNGLEFIYRNICPLQEADTQPSSSTDLQSQPRSL